MFRCAKHFHDLHYNLKEGSGDQYLDRAFIRRWKTKIYRFLEQEENISQQNFQNYKEDTIFEKVILKFK
jgi:hypothetical protein